MANPSAAIIFALFSAFWSIIFEATCNDSFSDKFATFIISRTEAVDDNAAPMDNRSAEQNLVALDLERVRELQQMIGQTAIDHIVVEDGIFSGVYSCQSNIEFQFDVLSLGDGKMHWMLFSFGAILSAEIDGPKQTASENSNYLRSLLKAYECVGGSLKQDEGSSSRKLPPQFQDPENSIPNFDILPFFGRNSIDQLNVEKIFIKRSSAAAVESHRQNIGKFVLLKALSSEELSPFEVINLANVYLRDDKRNPFYEKSLQKKGLTIQTFAEHPAKHHRIAGHLLLHLLNLEPNNFEQNRKRHYFENDTIPSRVLCVLMLFIRNLVQRVENEGNRTFRKFYFAELNSNDQNQKIKTRKGIFEGSAKRRCEKMQNEKGKVTESSESGEKSVNIYAHYDKAIRIDWNIWKGVKSQVNYVIRKTKQLNEKNIYKIEDAMRIINSKFNEIVNLKNGEISDGLNAEKLCKNSAMIIGKCEKEINKYEIEIPYRADLLYRKKEISKKMADIVEIIMDNPEDRPFFTFKIVNDFLEKLFNFSTKEILMVDENPQKQKQFKCRAKKVLLKNVNFEKAISVILSREKAGQIKQLINSINNEQNYVKLAAIKNKEMHKTIEQKMKWEIDTLLFNLLFSFAVRLEALVHGKNEEGIIIVEEFGENSKDKIRAFFAVLKCFPMAEWENELILFADRTEIEMHECGERISIAKYDQQGFRRNQIRRNSKDNFQILKNLNEYKFSVYESTKMLKKIYEQMKEISYGNYNSFHGNNQTEEKMPKIIGELIEQIHKDFRILREVKEFEFYLLKIITDYFEECEYFRLQKYILVNLERMLKENGIANEKNEYHANVDKFIQEKFEKECKMTLDKRTNVKVPAFALKGAEYSVRTILSNIPRYELAMNFEFNALKDIHDRLEDFLIYWNKRFSDERSYKGYEIEDINEFLKKIVEELIPKIEEFKVNIKGGELDLKGLVKKCEKLKLALEKTGGQQKQNEIGKMEMEMKKQQIEKAEQLVSNILKILEEKKNSFAEEMAKEGNTSPNSD